MGWALVLSSLLYFVVLEIQIKACNGCIEKERRGLLEMKAYFVAQSGDIAESELVSWVDDRSSNCCFWDRLKCGNLSTGHVTELSLNELQDFAKPSTMLNFSLLTPFQELVSLNLSGNMFQDWIGNEGFSRLKKLEALDLSSNYLNTSILLSLNGLTSLRILKLNANSMDGSCSAKGISSLKKLETLDLSGNNLNANIVPWLSGLRSLRTLNLNSNSLNGSFPALGFSNLKKLETLDLSRNSLNSSVIWNLNGLTSLRTLRLNSNSMNGSFNVGDLDNFRRLEVLDMSSNGLKGTLNTDGLQNLKNLKVLGLSENQLMGSIEGLCKMKDLVELTLSGNMFDGKLPECMRNLTSLHILDLSNNLFNGKFPSFTTNLTSLAYLSFFGNYLQGSFSLSTLANHSKLQVLYISSQSPGAQIETEDTTWFPKFQLTFLILQNCNLNKDKGSTIPRFLLYQHDLQFIDLSHNKLVGDFPSWLIKNNSRIQAVLMRNNSFTGIFQLFSIRHELHHLDISNNNISSVLPKDIGNLLPEISNLNLSKNMFEGKIPASIGEMKELWLLDLSQNHFAGELPERLAIDCIELELLKLSSNFLQGNISEFAYGSSLQALYLDNNNFSGTLEGILKNNTQLEVLDISNNSISGVIPSSIGKFFYMHIFLVAENLIEGQIPFEFSNISGLEMLDLSGNRLFGSIPYLNISSLRFLYLQKNDLSGVIPHTLSESSKLVTLDLRDNKLSGNIPYWINKLSKLRVLLLGGNSFHGHIPIHLCQLKSITIMDLSRNMINGSIPSCLKNLSFGMLRDDDYDSNFYISSQGSWIFYMGQPLPNSSVELIPPMNEIINSVEDELLAAVEFRTKRNYYSYKGDILEIMTGLDLSCNMFTDIIPYHIGNMQQIHALNLSHNYLSGSIPLSFSNLTQIESLDLSYNNLSGQIPSQLTRLNFLSIFNVSYNNLSGVPPSTGQFANFDEDNYKGNPNLCGPLLTKKCTGIVLSPPSLSHEKESKETTLDMVAFFWSFSAAYVTILFGFAMVLYINAAWRMAWFYYMEDTSSFLLEIDKIFHHYVCANVRKKKEINFIISTQSSEKL